MCHVFFLYISLFRLSFLLLLQSYNTILTTISTFFITYLSLDLFNFSQFWQLTCQRLQYYFLSKISKLREHFLSSSYPISRIFFRIISSRYTFLILIEDLGCFKTLSHIHSCHRKFVLTNVARAHLNFPLPDLTNIPRVCVCVCVRSLIHPTSSDLSISA